MKKLLNNNLVLPCLGPAPMAGLLAGGTSCEDSDTRFLDGCSPISPGPLSPGPLSPGPLSPEPLSPGWKRTNSVMLSVHISKARCKSVLSASLFNST